MNKFYFILFFTTIYHVSAIDYDGWLNFKIDHSLNCDVDKYCDRGNISIKSIRAGTPLIEQIILSQEHILKLKELASLNGFYTLRTTVTSADNKITSFLSSVKAQAFLENGLSDVINVWILPNGAVTAVNFQSTNMTQSLVQTSKGYSINSKFFLHYVEHGPVPDTTSYIQKLEREREARDKGEVKDNRSFIAKYWMYIVPIAIFVMISGATNPEGAANAR